MSEPLDINNSHLGDRASTKKAVDVVSAQRLWSNKLEEEIDESNNYDKFQPALPRFEAPGGNALTRIASRVTTRSLSDPGPPPDGGFRAWIQCVMAWIVIFNTWGSANAYGLTDFSMWEIA